MKPMFAVTQPFILQSSFGCPPSPMECDRTTFPHLWARRLGISIEQAINNSLRFAVSVRLLRKVSSPSECCLMPHCQCSRIRLGVFGLTLVPKAIISVFPPENSLLSSFDTRLGGCCCPEYSGRKHSSPGGSICSFSPTHQNFKRGHLTGAWKASLPRALNAFRRFANAIESLHHFLYRRVPLRLQRTSVYSARDSGWVPL